MKKILYKISYKKNIYIKFLLKRTLTKHLRLSILRLESHTIRYGEPPIPNPRAACVKRTIRC